MSENKNWQWYCSSDEERYDGGFATREEAIEEGRDTYEGAFFIMEATKGKLDFRLDAGIYFDMLDNQNEEQLDPDGGGMGHHLTKEQSADLVKTINDTIASWLMSNKISLDSWGFDETRNKEKIAALAA